MHIKHQSDHQIILSQLISSPLKVVQTFIIMYYERLIKVHFRLYISLGIICKTVIGRKHEWRFVYYFLLLSRFNLTLSWRRPISYRNQSIDLRSKSMDWFLYDIGLRHERVKSNHQLYTITTWSTKNLSLKTDKFLPMRRRPVIITNFLLIKIQLKGIS